MIDWQLLIPMMSVVLLPLGFLLACFAAYRYVRYERSGNEMRKVPTALVMFGVHYALVVVAVSLEQVVLLPAFVLFLALVGLIVAACLGFGAHSPAGLRVALAGLCTVVGYSSIAGGIYCDYIGWLR